MGRTPVSITDRWHLARPPADAPKCGKHKGKVASAEHGTGLQWQVRGTDDRGLSVKRNFAILDDARTYDAELKVAVKAGTYIDDRAARVTFAEYAEQWRRTRRKQGHSTAERIERGLRNHVYPVIGHVPMGVLSRRVSLVREWIGGMDLHPNSARLLIGTVSAIFQAAIDDRLMARNPLKAGSVDKPDAITAEVRVWSAGQVEAVADGLPERLAGLAWLGGVTGMRQGELFGLAVDDVDWLRRSARVEAQVVQVGSGLAFGPVKNRKPRTVPIGRPVVPLLSRHVELFPPVAVTLPWSQKGHALDGKPVTRKLLFADPRGTAYYRQTVNRPWRKAWQSAGVPDAGRHNGMHVLRHTAASQWLSKGLNVAKVAAYLGDTAAVVWKTYAHWMPDDDNLGRSIMDEFLDPGNTGSAALERPDDALGGGQVG
jgi:integrase